MTTHVVTLESSGLPDHESPREPAYLPSLPKRTGKRANPPDNTHGLTLAAMTGDIKAVVAVVKIVHGRVHLNGLEPAMDDLRATSQTPLTVVLPPTS